jgi:hypothetical protein
VLAARVYLLDDSAPPSGTRRVAYQGHHDITIPLPTANAHELVLGTARAYRQLMDSMTQDLSAHAKTAVATDR